MKYEAIYEKFKIVNESLSSFKLLKIHKLENFLNFKKNHQKISQKQMQNP